MTVLRTSSTLGLPTPHATRHVFRALQAELCYERRWPAEVVDATDAASGSDRTWSQHVESVLEKGMLRGAAVFLMVRPDLVIPSSVASVTSGAQLTLPPVTGSMVATMLEACGTVPSPNFSEFGEADLSADADYSDLSSMQFAHAWNGATAGDVFARLRAVSAAEKDAARPAVHAGAPPAAGPTLWDVHGLGEARHSLERIVADTLDWQAGTLAWSDINGSFLLHGPPGVGKTMTARALATEIGGPLIDLSYGTT